MPFGISSSSSSSSSEVPDFQRRPLQQNFNRGAALVPGVQQNIQNGLPQFNQQVTNPAFQAFNGLVQVGGAQNPYLEQQISTGVGNLNENFLETILPGLRRGSTTNAGFGASSAIRGQLAESNAAGELLDAQGQFEAQARGQAFNNQLGAQLSALQQAPNLLNLFTGANNAPFSALLNQAQILGNPILETESSSSSGGFSFG